MPLGLIEDAFGDRRNTRFLAVASELAYLPADDGAAAFREQLGLDSRLISVDNTQVYVGGNAGHVVVAFRGTESGGVEGLKDWLLTDAMNLMTVPAGRLGTDFIAAGVGARFHKGFLDALAEVWEPLFAAVAAELKASERPLWVTGHSLGGALALLASWLFARKMVQVHQVYTFGAPMVGNAAATEAFDRELQGRVFRYVNALDPVPQLPTVSMVANDYGHCQKEILLGAAAAASLFADVAAKAVGGALTGTALDDAWAVVVERVGAHGMGHYRGLLERADAAGE